ncbi:GNAT family N-acetyltransferase [Paraurantiacibacter namhicola]|uniref:BioF2-like acetyltransferase domain-containing protein n=1 Tax=Paraurantiacibacter namhicola TaxID=645517 RepID=A0A1C7D7I7_9SPHN|nr:GNAT family N-acetyltransferase [Paraurantiacibacter namhicola]ANU07446.1 hypothetical protein A6F65_01139 [Paraurantiacibacter namhicola]
MRLRAVSWYAFDNSTDIARWDALADHASEPNPFFESWYLLPSLRGFDPRGKAQILVFEVDGELAGLMPLVSALDYYTRPVPHLTGWAHANMFLGAPLVATGLEREFWQHLFDWADMHCGSAAFLHLAGLPLDGVLADALRTALAVQARPASLAEEEERALLQSDLTPDEYLESALKKKRVKELNRKMRRLQDLGELVVESRDDAEGVDRWAQQFLSLEMAGWKGKAGSALACAPETERMFCAALEGAARLRKLQRLSLVLDGKPVAMLATFITARGAFGFKTAFDESLSRLSPGVVLQRENLSLLTRGDVDWCDSCASADHPMIDHFWRERRRIGRINIAIGGAVRRSLFQLFARVETGQPADYGS